MRAMTFALSDLAIGRGLGHELICADARYASVAWIGADRLDRRFFDPAAWPMYLLALGLRAQNHARNAARDAHRAVPGGRGVGAALPPPTVPDSWSVNLTTVDPADPADSFGSGSAPSCEFACSLVSQETHDWRYAHWLGAPCGSVRFLRVSPGVAGIPETPAEAESEMGWPPPTLQPNTSKPLET